MRKLFKEVIKSFFKPFPFITALVATYFIQIGVVNNWINQKNGTYSNAERLIFILVVLGILDILWNFKIQSLFKIKSITPLDTLLTWITITSLFNWVIFFIIKFSPAERDVYLGIAIISFDILLCHMCSIIEKPNIAANISTPLIELKQLTEGPILAKTYPISIDERAVTDDLFDRSTIKSELERAIKTYSPHHSYTVGVTGPWGSGKTTLLNLARKSFSNNENSDIVFMHPSNNKNDSLDLWLLGSQEELIKGMYNTFLSSIGIQYNSLFNEKMINDISKVISEIPTYGKMISPFISKTNSYESITKLKDKLATYIKDSGKHYIFCIENLDRAEDYQIILLLKLINSVFDLPNVTYVLLYDKDRLNKILADNQKTNNNFADKVINQEINAALPLDSNVCRGILKNLLLSYGIQKSELHDFDVLLETIVKNSHNIREFKRIINSVFAILAMKDNLRLYLPHVLAIQYIHFSNIDLYNEIYSNKDMFIFNPDREVREEESKKYFDNDIWKTKYKDYIDLIKDLFLPAAQKLKNAMRTININPVDRAKKATIDANQYFEQYFLLAENDYVKINIQTRKFVQEINSGNNIEQSWNNFLNSSYESDLLLELVSFTKKDDIPENSKRLELANMMLSSINSKTSEWSYIDKEHIAWCIRNLIKELDSEKFYSFIEKINNLDIISHICNSFYSESNQALKNQTSIIDLYNAKCKEIINKQTNLFSNKNYKEDNIYGLLNNSHISKEDKIKYVGNCISKETIVHIIEVAIIPKLSELRFTYSIFKEIFNRYKHKTLKILQSKDFQGNKNIEALKNYLSKTKKDD